MRKTIFVIDDNVSVLALAEEALEKHYLVITLTSAESMFAIIDKVKPDLILLDMVMTNMDGIKTLKQLKSNPKLADIPVIFMSGLIDLDTEVQAIELGVTDFIAKPFSEALLKHRLKNYLSLIELSKRS